MYDFRLFCHWLSMAAMILTICGATMAVGQTIVEPIDFIVEGDDETVVVEFDNDFPPGTLIELSFEGQAANRIDFDSSNGIRTWLVADGMRVSEFLTVDLPIIDPQTGPVYVPFELQATVDSSPARVGLLVEGLGCCDDIRVTGTWTQSVQVPEPSSGVLILIGMMVLGQWRRRSIRQT